MAWKQKPDMVCAECGTPISEAEEHYVFITLGATVCAECVEQSRKIGIWDDTIYPGRYKDVDEWE
jgi:hypothetical protein